MKGATVAVTITGTNTAFTAASKVTISGDRIKINKVAYVSPTSITAEFVLETDTASDARVVTVTSGTEIDTASFAVTPDVTDSAQAAPNSANIGDKAFITIIGTDTAFDVTSKLTFSGKDITVKDIAVLGPNRMTADVVVSSAAPVGARAFTITTGTTTAKGTFTITSLIDTTTTIVTSAAKGTSATLTATVKPNTGTGVIDGYVSFLENKGGGGFKDILATVPLSGGTASLPLTNLSVGAHSFYAQYLGDNASFAQSESTVDAVVRVTANPGSVVLAETATLQVLPDGRYEAIVTVANSGKGTAKAVMLTSGSLGGVSTSEPLPAPIADIAPGTSASAVLTFPASAGTPGTASVLKFTGTYTGGNFTGATRVTLP